MEPANAAMSTVLFIYMWTLANTKLLCLIFFELIILYSKLDYLDFLVKIDAVFEIIEYCECICAQRYTVSYEKNV